MVINVNSSPQELKTIVKNSSTTSLVIEVVKHPNADDSVFEAAINHVKTTGGFTRSNETQVLSAIVENTDSVSTLIKVIKSATDVNVIIESVKHPNANNSVFDVAINHVKTTGGFTRSNETQVLSAVEERKKANEKLKIFKEKKVEAPEMFTDSGIKITIEHEDSDIERLRLNVEDGASTMLWGLSGVGKTSRVAQIDPTYTEIRLKPGQLPEEVVGGKEPNGKPGELYAPKWFETLWEKCKKEPDRMHILFIDEITNVKEPVKSLVMDIIENRRVNGVEDWKLPDNCSIVAAGNRAEESTAVAVDYNGGVMSDTLHRRFDFHMEIKLDMLEWQKWALETNYKTGFLNIHPMVLSFCIANADKVMYSTSNDDVTQPLLDPRRWAKLSKIMFMAEKRGGIYTRPSDERISECIGNDLLQAFTAYYDKYRLNALDFIKVRKGLYTSDDFKNAEDKLLALGFLIGDNTIDRETAKKFISDCLGEEYVSIYEVMKGKNAESIADSQSANLFKVK